MKATIFSLVFFLIFSWSFAQKYWAECNVSEKFDLSKTYTVAILPVVSIDASIKDRNDLLDVAYDKLSNILTGVKNFQVANKDMVVRACYKYAFGGGDINSTNYQQIAAEVNANVIALIKLSKEKQLIKKKEIGTIMAFIQFFDVNNNNVILYSGKGRSINPLSEIAEVELAVEKAVKGLIEKK